MLYEGKKPFWEQIVDNSMTVNKLHLCSRTYRWVMGFVERDNLLLILILP